MSNPFSGIITPELKALYKNAIDALLEEDSLAVPCTLTYSGTKFTLCPNCVYDNLMKRSSNKYKLGGPIPFYQGVCPYCAGVGRVNSGEATEVLHLAVIWDSKSWVVSATNVLDADIDVQTISSIILYDQLTRASKITIDDGIKRYGTPDFVKKGAPTPLGFGNNDYIICSWGRT